MSKNLRVAVAMSGGVDSSVAALLLQKAGYRVIGIMLRLWSEPEKPDANRCCNPDSMQKARSVAAQLNIPFYVIDAQKIFHDTIVKYFINGYTQGITPNPCLECNRKMRWDFLLKHAQSFGVDYFATGHYAKVVRSIKGEYQLWKANDTQKDQSYVLYSLGQRELFCTIFPLSGYTKSEVRQIATDNNLPVARRTDSQDLCFIAGDDYRNFLHRNAPNIFHPGLILDLKGNQIGFHNGLPLFTIGQRKRLGISAPYPLYVLEKITERNLLIVGKKGELVCTEFFAHNVNWITDYPPEETIEVQVKVRYRGRLYDSELTPLPQDSARIFLKEPGIDIAPGQAAVFYHGKQCLGGGIIAPMNIKREIT